MYKRFLLTCLVGVSALALLATAAQATTIDLVTVGDPGNPADTVAFNAGSVNYTYQISKYETTVGQYLEFLNAKAASNSLGLYNAAMGNTGGLTPCGIQQNGSEGSFTYSLVNEDWSERPICWVTFFNAVRFANWMENGQGSGDTEDGSYTIPDDWAAASGTHNSFGRNPGATWVVASNDEWHKAAYYDSSTQTYWNYATQTDLENPPLNIFDGDPNRANVFDGSTSHATISVGSYVNAVSPYGTFDQTGNAQEWTDTREWVDGRVFRQGPCTNWQSSSSSDKTGQFWPLSTANGSHGFGFRLVHVPEPGTLALILMGMLCVLWRRNR